ncbi:hypothetical protein C0Q70_09317 [Pomacea canaliculata]|uniref:EF-hand domain-containing protein n=1 Tax=Pomacea canaliculata TaxID=400727 RepID=A0A2T7P9H5_POMCA|nr:hypothetical protein C0Q70_09317 [Pomacea canaliculata]
MCLRAPSARWTRTRQHEELIKDNQEIVVERNGARGNMAGRYERSSSHYDDVDFRARRENPAKYRFQFENLVFEGGGNKGLAYCGAVKYLEELGLMEQIKSFAGSSAGGMMAALLALGYKADEVEQFLSDRIDEIFIDHSCGYCSLLPNLLRDFGWNPGKKIYNWFGDKVKSKTNNADLTFKELYHLNGKMLCIVVTNLSQMTTEYCHPKTTPDMPIRVAVRMSMAIPGMFSALRYDHYGQKDVYVDGGVLCNYPIHCFDGWYLSMSPEDSFVRRLQPLQEIPIIMERNNRFGAFNNKTLGMLLYADGEDDILRYNLEKRADCLIPREPKSKTKLYLQRQKEAKVKERAQREHGKVVQAVDNFLKVSRQQHNFLSLEIYFLIYRRTSFPKHKPSCCLVANFTVQKAFDLLDRDKNGKIRYDELVHFIEANGVCLQTRFVGYQRKEIKNFVNFLDMLQNTLVFNVKKLYVESRDLDRTVGINTGHVSTTDFVLEEADREFVVQRGYFAMRSFLRYYVVNNRDMVERKEEDRSTLPPLLENELPVPS